ncbi:MAG: ABC transporter ATP-binding protein [Parasporobacterium sp.]|nr:ABC transporter ATP-binding protein [Parasporobacterium sp.]
MHRGNGERASLRYLGPLIKYIKKYLPMFLAAILCAIGGTVCTIIGPKYVSKIADIISSGLMGNMDVEGVARIGITLVIVYAAAWILSVLQGVLMTGVTQKTSYSLRKDISKQINILPLKYFDTTLIGDILSRVVNDVDTIGMTMSQSVGNLCQSGTQFIGVLIIMFSTCWQLTLVAIGSSIIGFVFMIVIMGRSQKYFVAAQRNLGALNGHIEEMYSGHDVVNAYGAEAEEGKKFDKLNEDFTFSIRMSQFLGSLMPPIMSFVGNLGYVAVCVTGAIMAINGTITFGVIVAFMIYIRLFTAPLQQFGQVFTQLQSTAAASKRVFEFLEEEVLPDDMNLPIRIPFGTAKGNIEFKHVNFGYDPDKTIIHDFSVLAPAGKKVAIVGPTGAGKTTMVNLLMRFYEVTGGEITIDGIPITTMRREEVHALFGMVLQDTWLFEGTIRENIRYGKDASDEKVIEAAKAAGIHHFIMTMSKGYDTVLDENANVSAGQKQLITIARAMVEDAPFLILDEATSSVDTRTEELIQEAMDRLMKGRTSFIIAHRLSTIKNADLILVMKDGDIIEQGNHEELMAQKGFYADLYNSQFDQVD